VPVNDAVNALGTGRAVYVSITLNQAELFNEVLSGKYNDLVARAGRIQ